MIREPLGASGGGVEDKVSHGGIAVTFSCNAKIPLMPTVFLLVTESE